MTADTILLFISASIILALIPGQDMILVIAKSISHGRKTGIITSLGLMLGILFHTLLTATGLSAIIMASSHAFTVIKYLGSAYLIYLGVKTFLSQDELPFKNETLIAQKQPNLTGAFKDGVISSSLNPKLALFFLSFLPQFVSSGADPFYQIMLLGLLFMLSALPILISTVLIAAYLNTLFSNNLQTQKYSRILAGTIFMSLGIYLASTEKNS